MKETLTIGTVTHGKAPQKVEMPLMLRLLLGLFLSALGALLFTLAFPPYSFWPLAFIWAVPVMLAVHRVMPERLSGLAMGVGVGGFFHGYFGGMFEGILFMQYLPLLIGVIAALMGSRDRPFHARTGYRWFVLHGAAVWVGVEMIRGFIPVIGTWGFAAYTVYQQPWMIQPVSIFSIYGMSLLIMLFNYALAQLLLVWMDRHWRFAEKDVPVNPARAMRWAGGICLLLLAWGGISLSMYRAPEPDLQVAAVQPAAIISAEADEEGISKGLEIIDDLTRQAADDGASFIVWPEGFLSFDPQEKETSFFTQLAEEIGAYIAIGYAVQTDEGLRNEATVLSPEGKYLGVFGKDHPVAFAGETSITRGTYPVYDTEIGSLGTIICYDLDFTDTARKVASNGAEVIGVPSADWPAIAHKHYSHVVFRAVENRVSMIKADTAFDSAIIDPYGNIINKHVSPVGDRAVLVEGVPLGSSDTINMRWGDWIGWISLAAMIFFLGMDLYTAFR